ncbi:Abi-alpha family protein [Amycolatopsis sp. H20-H5]|uniref:Abi-alpha family protein n=1 Tax=Amycolatopsis sp. H20-H5 TaxID=3046309 RepID=UPI002DB80CFA|nr:Abi-alpha family protein [Amycolatopsis sp. H20-H5]MEC3979930.1 Abi-alpha family protein [Amycolatopsis sp. H20-H5]
MTNDRPADRGTGDELANLVQRAGQLAGWAARTGFQFGKRLPGIDTAERGIRTVERQLLTELRRRLDEVDDPYHAALTAASAMNRTPANGTRPSIEVTLVPARDNHIEPLRAAMAELLNHSIGFGRERAREYLYAIILRQLTPDEARILSALSDGSPFPLIDVAERTSLGAAGRIVLRNASTVGKAAGVSLNDQVPGYLTRLIGLGLVDLDEEVPSLETQYEILMTDETVREAENAVKRVKFIRRTVHISRLGASFWRACDPSLR